MLPSMPPPLLAYRKAANPNFESGEYGGRVWLAEHDVCPYCSSTLSELGSFHAPAHNLVKMEDPNFAPAFCTKCGCGRTEVDESSAKHWEEAGRAYYKPRNVTHGACLFRVATCNVCGWWLAVEDADIGNNGYANGVCGILESFDVSSASIPLEVLSEELPRQLHRIHDVHPRKMQDLVGSVLSGVYACEVHQVGFSRDGGVDLLLLTADAPIAVQVKRRESSTRAEAVSGVREFLGAALLLGHSDMMYVTTAPLFFADAIAAANSAVKRQLVRSFQLIQRSELAALLRSVSTPNNWQVAIEAARKNSDHTPKIPNPYELKQHTDD